MQIVLVSDDSDFFEYIASKLLLRKNDELFLLKFEEIPDNLYNTEGSVLIINSENSEEQTIELLKLSFDATVIVFAYNEYKDFKSKVLRAGAYSFVTPLTPEEEFQAVLISALRISSLMKKNKMYREILEKKNLIKFTNEVLLDYNLILDQELEKIHESASTSVLAAISPDDKTKFLVNPNQLETIILNNIRKSDILMNYAVNKYFLLLYDTDLDDAKKIWAKISSKLPFQVYAGFARTFSKNRQQLVNEALNKLHEALNFEKISSSMSGITDKSGNSNFKLFRQELNKKIEYIVLPVFYHIKQKYNDKLFGVSMEQECTEQQSVISLVSRNANAQFKITAPGFSNINIDITFASSQDNIDAKRITLTSEEFEEGLLEDLLEQFIQEFKKETDNGAA